MSQIELSENQINEIAQRTANISSKMFNAPKPMPYMSIKEIARYLGKSGTSIRNFMRSDRSFPVPMKIGGEYRFDFKDVKIWLEMKKKEGERTFRPFLRMSR
ncbi:MAG: helix-turn-helix domain-containing protein [Elusimicrobiota bacterium]|jgi:excisionase family DNA binding protein|nr:helix-turn-helix domain-containing protein [Elusimicrobiota bacterium]